MEHNSNLNNHSFINFFKQNKYFVVPLLLWIILGGIGLSWEQDRIIYKWVNNNNHHVLDAIMPYITYLGEGLFVFGILLLFLMFLGFKKGKRVAWVLLLCNLVPFVLTQIVKQIVNAPRPLKFFNEAGWIHRISGQPVNYDFSFPSGHSEGAFALFSSIALLLHQRYKAWGLLCFILALSVAYSRIYLSQHFYRDVYAGSLIGAICCIFIFYRLYGRKANE